MQISKKKTPRTANSSASTPTELRFGIATCDITPPFPTAMSGYGVRRDVFDAVNDRLSFTALILESGGKRAFIGAGDLCNFPNDGSTPKMIERLAEITGAASDHIMLCASHTHGGPKMPSSSSTSENQRFLSQTRRYRDWLARRMYACARDAAKQMRAGSLWIGEGATALPMNRRPSRNGGVPNAPNPKGPTDQRMTLLALRESDDSLAAIGMRVSCHPVATGAKHLITADFVGAWRSAFTEVFGPKVIPFFLQGAGADARPRAACDGDAWRAVPHVELPGIGRELLAETMAILSKGLHPAGRLVLKGKSQTVRLPCEKTYAERKNLERLAKTKDAYYMREGLIHIVQAYAREGLRRIDKGDPYPDYAEYQIQTLWLTDDLAFITLNAEPLCGLGAYLEQKLGARHALTIGYVNGSVSYLPDSKELKRGGYEADSYIHEGWSGPWVSGLEKQLAKSLFLR